MEIEMLVPYEEELNTNEFSDQTPDQVMAESSSSQATLQYMSTMLHNVVAGDGTNDFPVVHDHEAAIGLKVTGTEIQPDEAPNQVWFELPEHLWFRVRPIISLKSIPNRFKESIPPSFKETVVSLLLSVKSIRPSFKETVVSLLLSVKSIPPRAQCTLLVFIGSAIKFLAEGLIGQIHYQLGNSSNTTPALQSFGEAFGEFWPHIRDKTAIMVMYALVLLLIWPMEPAYQVMIIVMLFGVPVYYIPDLLGKMSGVDVTCGMIKLPLFCVTTLSAIALFFIFGFLILLVIYLIQRYISPERSRGMEVEGSNTTEEISITIDRMKEQ